MSLFLRVTGMGNLVGEMSFVFVVKSFKNSFKFMLPLEGDILRIGLLLSSKGDETSCISGSMSIADDWLRSG